LRPFPLLVFTRLSQEKCCQNLLPLTPGMGMELRVFACAEVLIAKPLLFREEKCLVIKAFSNCTESLSHILQMVLVTFFWPQYSISQKKLMFPILASALR